MQVLFSCYIPGLEELVLIGQQKLHECRRVWSIQDNVTLQHFMVFENKIPCNNTPPVMSNEDEFFAT
jgi:hypothetical protein